MSYLYRFLLPPSHKWQMTEGVWWTANTGHSSLEGKPPTPETPSGEPHPGSRDRDDDDRPLWMRFL